MPKIHFPAFNTEKFSGYEIRQLVSALELRFQALEADNDSLFDTGTDIEAHSHTESDITDLGNYITNISAESIFDLSDVDGTPSLNDTLVWNGSGFEPGSSGTSIELDQLTDVFVPNPSDAEVLTWVTSANRWEATGTSGITSFVDLTDTDLFGQAQFDLAFNATGGEWQHTNGKLSWHPAAQHLQLANGYSINWLNGAGTTVELLEFTALIAADTAGVELLVKFEGADAATDYTEVSANAAVATFVANAQIDTDQFNFGASSLLLDGTGDSVTFPDIAAYDFDTSDWTVEGFVRFNTLPPLETSIGPGYVQFAMWGATTPDELLSYAIIQDAFGYRVRIESGRTGFAEVGTISGGISTGVWYHWAVTRESGTINAYFNGNFEVSDFGVADADMGGPTGPIRIGALDASTAEHDGWIDDVRMTIGTARYTGMSSYSIPDADFATPTPETPEQFNIGDPSYDTIIDGLITNITSIATYLDGSLNMQNDQPVNWLDAAAASIEMLIFNQSAVSSETMDWYTFESTVESLTSEEDFFVDTENGLDQSQAGMVHGDWYMMYVRALYTSNDSSAADFNQYRVAIGGVEVVGSQDSQSNPTGAGPGDKHGSPYGYLGFFQADTAGGNITTQHKSAVVAGGSVGNIVPKETALILNLSSHIPNHQRAASAVLWEIDHTETFQTSDTHVAVGAGDWLVMVGMRCQGFNGLVSPQLAIHDGTRDWLVASNRAAGGSGDDLVVAGMYLFKDYAGGTFTLRAMSGGAIADLDVTHRRIIAIPLSDFLESAGVQDTSDTTVYVAEQWEESPGSEYTEIVQTLPLTVGASSNFLALGWNTQEMAGTNLMSGFELTETVNGGSESSAIGWDIAYVHRKGTVVDSDTPAVGQSMISDARTYSADDEVVINMRARNVTAAFGSNGWRYHGMVLLRMKTLIEEQFTVGDPSYGTRIDGLTTRIASAATDIDGTLDVDGFVVMRDTLNVFGAVDFDSTLNVDGAATVHGLTTLNADVIINDQATINATAGNTPLTISGDMGDATTPLVLFDQYNIPTSTSRRMFSFIESPSDKGWFIDMAQFIDENNEFILGNNYGSSISPTLRLTSGGEFDLANGRFVITADTITFDATDSMDVIFEISGNDGDTAIHLIADDDNATETHNPYIFFSQDGGAVLGSIGMNSTDKDSRNNAFTDMLENGIAIHAEYVTGTVGMGVNGQVAMRIQPDNNIEIMVGKALTFFDSTNSDTAIFNHDDTDFNTAFTGTTDWNITGLSGFNVVNYLFDVDQTVGASQDGDVLTYNNGTGLIALKPKTYGGISVTENTDALTLNVSADVQVTDFDTDDPSNNTTPENANDHIVIADTGVYFVMASVAVKNAAGVGHEIHVDARKNDGATLLSPVHAHRSLSSGSDTGSISLMGLVALTAADTVELWAGTDSATDRDVTFEDVAMSVMKIGE